MSRNKLQGKYKGCRYGKHFRSLRKLISAVACEYGNPFYTGRPKVINP